MSYIESIGNFGVTLCLWGLVNYWLGSEPLSPTDIMGIGATMTVFAIVAWAVKKFLLKK